MSHRPPVTSLRLLLLSNAMGRGGAEIQVKDCAIRLARRGHHVLVVSMLPFEDFEAELRAAGVEVATLRMTKGQASTAALIELVRLIRRFRPDVLHAHMFSAILASRVARALLEADRLRGSGPLPAIIGTSHAAFEATRARYLAYRLTNHFGGLWTSVSREGLDRHEREGAVPEGSGVLTPNGVDVDAFRPAPLVRASARRELGRDDATFLWLAVGSFRDDLKDYDNILQAFAAAAKSTARRSHLLVAGHGVLLDEKKRFAASLGLAESVDFLGLRADVDRLMQAADGFVLGSVSEAMPMVLLEAGASALPAVVTDVGQCAELVVDARFVVPPKNAPALAAAMTELMALTDTERHALGERARAHVTNTYDLEVIVSEWERRYRAVLPGRG